MRDAQKLGVNATMAEAVQQAKTNHTWKNQTATLEVHLPTSNPMILQRKSVVLSQRMARPIFRTQNPTQIWMALKMDSNHIVRFTLVPIRDSPNGTYRRNLRQFAHHVVFPARNNDFQLHSMPKRQAAELIDNFDMRFMPELSDLLRISFEVIATAKIIQMFELHAFVITQKQERHRQWPTLQPESTDRWLDESRCRRPLRIFQAKSNECPEYP